jgi:hypothetical protein
MAARGSRSTKELAKLGAATLILDNHASYWKYNLILGTHTPPFNCSTRVLVKQRARRAEQFGAQAYNILTE